MIFMQSLIQGREYPKFNLIGVTYFIPSFGHIGKPNLNIGIRLYESKSLQLLKTNEK